MTQNLIRREIDLFLKVIHCGVLRRPRDEHRKAQADREFLKRGSSWCARSGEKSLSALKVPTLLVTGDGDLIRAAGAGAAIRGKPALQPVVIARRCSASIPPLFRSWGS